MNLEIRVEMLRHKITQLEVAKKLGIAEQSVCRNLRNELPEVKRVLYLQVIEEIKKEREAITQCPLTKCQTY